MKFTEIKEVDALPINGGNNYTLYLVPGTEGRKIPYKFDNEEWTVVKFATAEPPAGPNYLKLLSIENGSTIGFEEFSNTQTLEYSDDDGETWNILDDSSSITLNQNEYILVRGEGYSTEDSYTQFKMTGSVKASGDVTTLLDGVGNVEELPEYAFNYLFYECDGLISAKDLTIPASIMNEGSCCWMFASCANLVEVMDILPATTLAQQCYDNMFTSTAIVTAPALPATVLAPLCYEGMFSDCEALEEAPELPATELVQKCYAGMFTWCYALSSIKVGFSDWQYSESTPAVNPTGSWMQDVPNVGDFYCPAALDVSVTDEHHVPSGWTVHTV